MHSVKSKIDARELILLGIVLANKAARERVQQPRHATHSTTRRAIQEVCDGKPGDFLNIVIPQIAGVKMDTDVDNIAANVLQQCNADAKGKDIRSLGNALVRSSALCVMEKQRKKLLGLVEETLKT